MDTIKIIAVALATALVAVLGFGAIQGDNLAGAPGINILPSAQQPYSGAVYSTSTATNSTLLTEAIDDETVVAITLTQGSGTLTLMASSSVPGIPNPGDMRTIYIRNATTSASVTLTLAGATGVTLKRAASSTAMLIGDTDGSNTFKVDLYRKANTDIVANLTKFED